MRIIKFKFWDKQAKKMIADWGCNDSTINEQLNSGDFINLQFTGLKDKNGTEIYEGDIVDDQFNVGQLRKVYYSDKKACFMAECKWRECKELSLIELSCSPETTTKGCIIGNIYENPELFN